MAVVVRERPVPLSRVSSLSVLRRKEEQLYLGVYSEKGAYGIKYYAFIGHEEKLGEKTSQYNSLPLDEATRISVKRIPEVWNTSLSHIRDWKGKVMGLGYVFYFFEGKKAFVRNYEPRKELRPRVASGLPFFIEAIITSDLLRQGFTQISAAAEAMKPSRHRISQLERVGLTRERFEDMKTKEFLIALGRGISQTIKNAKRKRLARIA